MLYGNIQIEIEALWDAYANSTPQEQAYILAEIERLYAILRDAPDKELVLV